MKRTLVCIVGLLALQPALLQPAAAHADEYPRRAGLDVLEYTFRVSLTDDSDVIEGLATLSIAVRAGEHAVVTLDLAARGEEGRGMTVTGAWLGEPLAAQRLLAAPLLDPERGEPLEFEHRGETLRLRLPAPARAGERLVLTVAYHGVPADGLRIGPNRHGDRTFFSDDWPNRAHQWLPTIDHPYDKASGRMIVEAPAHYQVVSNGLLEERTDLGDGRRRTVWRQRVPIAPWLYVLGVARFAVHHDGDFRGRPVQTWVYPQDRDPGLRIFSAVTFHALEFFSDHIGPYAYDKLANVQSASVGGGMEAATAIFYGEESATGARPERWRDVIVHEIAHQWWGDAVTEADWDDVWLSEGFATYFTLLFREHADGRDAFVAGLQAARRRVLDFYAERGRYRVVHDNLADMSQVTTPMQYQKGAWVLHMLRSLLGDEAFWRGIRAYYREHLNGSATTADFRRAMEGASGRDLGWFFEQWLEREVNPEVTGTWRYDEAAQAIVLALRQTQEGQPFRLPVRVAWREAAPAPRVGAGVAAAGAGARRDTLLLLERPRQEFSIPAAGPPAELVADPDTELLVPVHLERAAGGS